MSKKSNNQKTQKIIHEYKDDKNRQIQLILNIKQDTGELGDEYKTGIEQLIKTHKKRKSKPKEKPKEKPKDIVPSVVSNIEKKETKKPEKTKKKESMPTLSERQRNILLDKGKNSTRNSRNLLFKIMTDSDRMEYGIIDKSELKGEKLKELKKKYLNN